MMIVKAIYENGLFRPLDKPQLRDGQIVQLTVETQLPNPEEMLQLAAEVYEGFSKSEIEEIEETALNRNHFFEG